MPAGVLEGGLAQLYAQALVAICRADDHVVREVGARLQERIETRAGVAVPLEDLLLAEPLEPASLAGTVGTTGPFRGAGVHAAELARLIVVDAVGVVRAKGHVTEREAHLIIRFATALGVSADELRGMTDQLTPFLTR